MGLKQILFFAMLFYGVNLKAEARSCLPDFTSLQALMPVHASFTTPLKSENGKGLFATKVLITSDFDAAAKHLQLHLAFDQKFQGVSLPYNLYAVLVIQDGVTLAFFDYTSGCQDAGLSFFPGGGVKLPLVKVPGESPLQIMVWGRL